LIPFPSLSPVGSSLAEDPLVPLCFDVTKDRLPLTGLEIGFFFCCFWAMLRPFSSMVGAFLSFSSTTPKPFLLISLSGARCSSFVRTGRSRARSSSSLFQNKSPLVASQLSYRCVGSQRSFLRVFSKEYFSPSRVVWSPTERHSTLKSCS